MDTLKIEGVKGRAMLARILYPGDKYGLNDCLTWGEPDGWDARTPNDAADWLARNGHKLGIEFYDFSLAGPKFGALGQFASRYYLETLIEGPWANTGGLCLHGGVPEWNIPASSMNEVRAWARGIFTTF